PAAAPAENDTPAVLGVLTAWAKAWSSKDPDAYLSYYADDFQPEGGISREQWEAQRRERIVKPARISVKVVKPQVSHLDAHRVRVNFLQDYSSDTLTDQIRKAVELSDAGGSWKIIRETVH
ncbi:MAG: hypothetical protein P4L83_17105, partial [Nevskia sp.]|nr:hypothetical protein [Nevskia sp.]